MAKKNYIIAIDTMHFLEMDLPAGVDPEEFANSAEARKEAARMILAGEVEFQVEQIMDENRDEVFPEDLDDDDEDDDYPSDPDEELEYLERLEQQENAGAA